MSSMRFEVNPDSVISAMIDGEIKARMYCRAQYPNDPEGYKRELQRYREAGIVDSTPAVISFIKQHPNVFRNPKLISSQRGNIFEEMITLAPQARQSDYDQKLKNRMRIGHDLTPQEMECIDDFLKDFHLLKDKPDIKEIIRETQQHRSSVERLWRANEEEIIGHVQYILGYIPESVGDVSTYVMYPNYDTHRSCQESGNSTSLFLGKRGKGTENKILAHLAHQAVHQPMLPYKISMSKQEKEKFHAFIKFLTDKEIFARLSGERSLGITTPQENHALMGKIYPYWLGYRFRNAKREGLEPVEEITREIQRDMAYFQALPEGSRARNNYSHYEFEKLDPKKIAEFFRFKKGMTPYEFIGIDFDNRDNVCKKESKDKSERRKQPKEFEEQIR